GAIDGPIDLTDRHLSGAINGNLTIAREPAYGHATYEVGAGEAGRVLLGAAGARRQGRKAVVRCIGARVHTIVRSAMNQGVRWRILSTNPALRTSPGQVEDIEPPSPEELLRLFDAAEQESPGRAPTFSCSSCWRRSAAPVVRSCARCAGPTLAWRSDDRARHRRRRAGQRAPDQAAAELLGALLQRKPAET
ncbi:MAG: hypothetical protein ACRD2W_00130, partial [Acidimicrobiales bacterium]